MTVGYFAWVKTRKPGEFLPKKFVKERLQVNPEAKKYYSEKTFKSWLLTAEEFSMSLAQLAERYPIESDSQT